MPKMKYFNSLLLLIFIVSCGDHKRFVSDSPDGRARVVATVPSGFGPAFRVVLNQDGKERELYLQHGFG